MSEDSKPLVLDESSPGSPGAKASARRRRRHVKTHDWRHPAILPGHAGFLRWAHDGPPAPVPAMQPHRAQISVQQAAEQETGAGFGFAMPRSTSQPAAAKTPTSPREQPDPQPCRRSRVVRRAADSGAGEAVCVATFGDLGRAPSADPDQPGTKRMRAQAGGDSRNSKRFLTICIGQPRPARLSAHLAPGSPSVKRVTRVGSSHSYWIWLCSCARWTFKPVGMLYLFLLR